MKKIVLAAFLALAAFFVASPEASALVKVEGRYWFTDLSDSVKISKGSVIGTNINITDDLGVDGSKNFWEGRATLELGHHKIRYGFTPLKWDGSRRLTQSVVFNGKTYSASANVNSKFKADYHRLGYEYDIIDLLQNRLGVIFEVKYFDSEARLNAPSLGLNESHSLKAPIPTVGIAGQVGLPMLISAGGEVTGITIGRQAYLVDAEAGVNIKPMPFVTISGGYRVFKLHLEKDNDKGNITLKGPFAMLRAEF